MVSGDHLKCDQVTDLILGGPILISLISEVLGLKVAAKRKKQTLICLMSAERFSAQHKNIRRTGEMR